MNPKGVAGREGQYRFSENEYGCFGKEAVVRKERKQLLFRVFTEYFIIKWQK